MPHLWHDTLSLILVHCDKTHCDQRTPTSSRSIRTLTPTITALLLLIPLGNGRHLRILLQGNRMRTHRQLICRRWPLLTFAVSLRLSRPLHGRRINRTARQRLDLRATTCRNPSACTPLAHKILLLLAPVHCVVSPDTAPPDVISLTWLIPAKRLTSTCLHALSLTRTCSNDSPSLVRGVFSVVYLRLTTLSSVSSFAPCTTRTASRLLVVS